MFKNIHVHVHDVYTLNILLCKIGFEKEGMH